MNLTKRSTVILFLALSVFFVYANTLLNGFVWDDEEQIVNNTVIRDWSNLPYILSSSTFYAGGAGLSGGFYRPILSFYSMLNYSLWGLDPLGYHLFQILFHFINVVLVYSLLKMIFFSRKVADGDSIAFFAALTFAIHPANVESVAYIGSIGEIFYVLFLLAGMLILLKGVIPGTREIKTRSVVLYSFLFFLALLSKETAVVGIPIIFVYLLMFVKPGSRAYAKIGLGTALAFSVYLFLRFFVAKIGMASVHMAPISGASFLERMLTVPYTVLSYLGLVFFPHYLSISRHFVVTSPFDIRFWGSLAILGSLFWVFAVFIRKKRSDIGVFFSLWFFIALAPVLNIIPLDMTMAERWLYMPIIGAIAGAVYVLAVFLQNATQKTRRVAWVACVAVIMALSVRTIARNADWKDGLTLYSHDQKIETYVSPQGSYDLENNLGVELFRIGKIEEAGVHFERSIALQPQWTYSRNNFGVVLERRGDLDGALEQYEKSIGSSDYYLAYENKASILIRLGRYAEAKEFLTQSLSKFPQNNRMKLFLSWLYAAQNVSPDPGSRQIALDLIGQILSQEPDNVAARQLFEAISSGKTIEI